LCVAGSAVMTTTEKLNIVQIVVRSCELYFENWVKSNLVNA